MSQFINPPMPPGWFYFQIHLWVLGTGQKYDFKILKKTDFLKKWKIGVVVLKTDHLEYAQAFPGAPPPSGGGVPGGYGGPPPPSAPVGYGQQPPSLPSFAPPPPMPQMGNPPGMPPPPSGKFKNIILYLNK